MNPRVPVLVGAGVISQRASSAAGAREPVDLMVGALERAGLDAGTTVLFRQANEILVTKGSWSYADPARLIADRLGARSARTVLADLGVLQTTLLARAAATISAGDADVVLIAGGEARYRARQALAEGAPASETAQVGIAPDERLSPSGNILNELEIERGLHVPVRQYAIIETALRHHRRHSLSENASAVANLWADFSTVAQANPEAWNRAPVTAEQISQSARANRMVALPYTKLLNSQWNVDQAAGLILCSAAAAEAAGVPRERWVFPVGAAESNFMVPLSARPELHRSPGFAAAGRALLRAAGVGVDDIAHIDLYSCFPVAVQIQAMELGIFRDRRLTVTGGMTFAGGPLNNYVFQAAAKMTEVLRQDPGSLGLLTAVSGMLTKQGVSLWSTDPPGAGFRWDDVSAEVMATTTLRPVVENLGGGVTVDGYTVVYAGDDPVQGIVVASDDALQRTIATTDDSDVLASMISEDWCGQSIVVAGGNFAGG